VVGGEDGFHQSLLHSSRCSDPGEAAAAHAPTPRESPETDGGKGERRRRRGANVPKPPPSLLRLTQFCVPPPLSPFFFLLLLLFVPSEHRRLSALVRAVPLSPSPFPPLFSLLRPSANATLIRSRSLRPSQLSLVQSREGKSESATHSQRNGRFSGEEEGTKRPLPTFFKGGRGGKRPETQESTGQKIAPSLSPPPLQKEKGLFI
jgi:hypothetical protein